MAIGVVRGRFELDAPALRTLKDLERQGMRTEGVMDRLGRKIDTVADRKDRERIKGFNTEVRRTQTVTRETARTVDSSWRRMSQTVDREVNRQVRSIGKLEAALEGMGASTSRPSVEINGIDEALAKTLLLQQRLDALDKTRATPRVAPGGGVIGPPGGGIGPGRGGGGAGGGGGGAVRSVGLGALNVGGGTGLAALGALLPLAQVLGGTAVAGGGSLLGAGAGAGALGATGAVGLAAGLAGVVAIAKPAINSIKETTKAQEGYNKALAEYGKNSDQARIAKAALDAQMKQAPRGTRQLLRERDALSRDFGRATRPGQESLVGLGVGTLQKARPFVRDTFAPGANRSAAAVGREGAKFGSFATGRTGRRAVGVGAGIFDSNLGNFRRATQYGLEAIVNIADAGRPFFKDATNWMVRWTRGWATSTRDVDKTRGTIKGFIGNLREWKDLTGATFGLMKALYNTGNQAGDSAVERLTGQLDEWTKWIEKNPRKVEAFFDKAVDDAARLGRGVNAIVGGLNRMATTLRPLLNGFSTLAEGAGAAGLLTPGAGALALGAYKGLRGGRGGGGAGGGLGGAQGPGIVPVGGMGAAGAAGRGGFGAALGGGYRNGFYRGAEKGWGMADSRLSGAVGAAGAGGRYGAGLAGGALAGAGRAYLPIAAIMGLLSGLGTEGNVGNKIQGGLSAASLGIIQAPTSAAARQDSATQATASFVDRNVSGAADTLNGSTAGLRRIQAEIDRLSAPKSVAGGLAGALTGKDNKFLGISPRGSQISKEQAKENAIRVRLLERERDALARVNTEQRVSAERAAKGRDAAKGTKIGGRIQEAFVRRAAGKDDDGQVKAFRKTRKQIAQEMDGLGRDGARKLAENSVKWAAQAAKANPKLAGQYRALKRQVVGQFKGMYQDIRIVNGQILDGSDEQWKKIAGRISSAAQRGVDQTSNEFKRLRQIALGALEQAGFSKNEAKGVFKLQSSSDPRKRGQAATVAKEGPNSYSAAVAGGTKAGPIVNADAGKRATGGRLGGKGLYDTVPMADGGLGAPGELVVNRHTESDHDRDARAAGLPTLAERVAGETRKHSDKVRPGAWKYETDNRAKGGAVGKAKGGGAAGGLQPGISSLANGLVRQFPGLSITSTTGGTHAPGSYHYRGLAADIGGPPDLMNRAAAYAGEKYGSSLTEGIHNPNLSIKDGKKVPSSFWGGTTWGGHANHIHLAVAGALNGGAAGGNGVGMGAAGGGAAVSIAAKKIAASGAIGAIGNKGAGILANALEEKVNAAIGSSAGAGGGGGPSGAGGAAPKGRVREWLAQALQITGHYSEANLNALYGRAMQESGGNPAAINNWDSNAKAGYPSQGLLQTIPQTFASYRDPSVPGGITDPIANSVAAIRYMFAKYGHIVGSNGKGYATGGRLGGRKGSAFAGSFRNGGSFVTKGPTMFEAGEGGSAETVTVEPRRPRRRRASSATMAVGVGGGISVAIDMGGVSMKSDADIEAVADKAATLVGKKIRAQLRGDDKGLMSDD